MIVVPDMHQLKLVQAFGLWVGEDKVLANFSNNLNIAYQLSSNDCEGT